MMDKIRWGVLSTALIGIEKVIPALQKSELCDVVAIASRDPDRATATAQRLGIAKAYGSYEELLTDPEIDAIYNPLPNHLHVPWSITAMEAGKHVLCEKPIALSADEGQTLVDAADRFPQLKVMEAFMYRHHPQWKRAKQIVQEGGLGELRTIQSFFSYFNDDPQNIRNQADIGGGALMDIGCYNISWSRFLFDAEPIRVHGILDRDTVFGTDKLASGTLDFGQGWASFTCSTQLAPYQRIQIFGAEGRVEIEIPCNAPPDRPCKMWYQRGKETEQIEDIAFDICDQYTLQGDAMARAILSDTPVPTPLSDAVANMRVVEAVVQSAETEAWVSIPC
jgi:predicted dehydrogenase